MPRGISSVQAQMVLRWTDQDANHFIFSIGSNDGDQDEAVDVHLA